MEQVFLYGFLLFGSLTVLGLLILAVMASKMLLEISKMLDKIKDRL